MNELLLVVAAIFILCAVVGLNKGFIKIVASLSATLIILVVVIVATPFVSQVLREHTPIQGMVEKKCEKILDVEDVDLSSRDMQIVVIEQSELPEVFKELLLTNNNSEVYLSLGVETFTDYVSTYFTKLIMDVVAFLLTFLLVTVVVRIALYILGVIGDLPVIGGLNRLAGGALGLATGLVIVWILFIAITVFYDFGICKLFLQNVQENEFLSFLYENNIILDYVTKFKA